MELPVLVEKIFGIMAFILGLSLLLQRRFWLDMVSDIDRKPLSLLFSSLYGLLIGLVIVLVHNQWTLNPSIIVTIIGWLVVIKSATFLLAPDFMLKLIPNEQKLSIIIPIEGGVLILISVLVLYSVYS